MSQSESESPEAKASEASLSAELPAPLPPANTASAEEEIRERADTVWTHGQRTARVTGVVGRKEAKGPRGRIAIIAGCRTPFAKAGTDFQGMSLIDMAGVAARELIARTAIDPQQIELSVFGCVVPQLNAPNLGREVVFRASLPMEVVGTTVNLACASSNRAITFGAEAILKGECEVVLAGGAESLSNVPIRFSDNAAHRFMELAKAKSVADKLAVISKLRPKDLAPVAPAIAEYTTGQSMGESAEKMAKENDISRRAQDEIALMSHQRAAAAHELGLFDDQIVPTFPGPKYGQAVTFDNGVRSDTSLEKLASLKPVFDRRYGTLSAGNSSPLTDGAAAVLLTSEKKAEELGLEPLGYIRSFAYAGVDPGEQLLQGPAYAAPAALDAAGVTLDDCDLVEMHEAFAAQILSNMKGFASEKFAREELGRKKAIGVIDFESFNVTGGSIAIGHPFGATGARVTMQVLHSLARRDGNLGLITVCAAGGTGFAMVVERE